MVDIILDGTARVLKLGENTDLALRAATAAETSAVESAASAAAAAASAESSDASAIWYAAGKQVVTGDGDISYHVGRADLVDGTSVELAADAAAGAGPTIVGIGDSLTEGVSGANYRTPLAALTNRTVINQGVGGQWTRQIGLRAGGSATMVTISGNTIVAGANTITHFDGVAVASMAALIAVGTVGALQTGQFLSTAASNATRTQKAWVGSVLGTVTRTSSGGPPSTSETYTFTPDAGQVLPAYCPNRTALIPINDYFDATAIIWTGTNSLRDPTQTKADIAGIVAQLRHERFVVIPPINRDSGASMYVGGTDWVFMHDLENELAALYPRNFLNIRRMLIDRGLTDAGMTADAQDTTNIANDVIPYNLRLAADTVHPNQTGHNQVAQYIYDFITPKGW